MDLKIFDEFLSSAITIIIETQTIPSVASGSLFKLTLDSSWHNSSSFW